MSRGPTSCSGRSGNLKVVDSNLDLAVFEPWLAQCEDNVTEWVSRSWCWQLGVPVMQYYKVAMTAH